MSYYSFLSAETPGTKKNGNDSQYRQYYAKIKGTDKEGTNNDKKQLEKWSVEPL